MIRQNFVSSFNRALWIFILALGLVPLFMVGVLAGSPTPTGSTPKRLMISSITLDSPIVPVGLKRTVVNNKSYKTWEVADREVGWNNHSARLGLTGNTVLTGHSDIKAKIFRNLEQVRLGDEITVFGDNGQVYRYIVTQKVLVQEKGVPVEVRLKNARWIKATDDERLTLVTCAQPGASHRLIVIAMPIQSAG